ncbi:MAG: hypothetical protein OXE50_16045, partial [Chloroflexi bacterium]|nr:hypothetical protein [Chloroflexota bacterium]
LELAIIKAGNAIHVTEFIKANLGENVRLALGQFVTPTNCPLTTDHLERAEKAEKLALKELEKEIENVRENRTQGRSQAH